MGWKMTIRSTGTLALLLISLLISGCPLSRNVKLNDAGGARVNVVETTLGKSVEDRPIRAWVMGEGSRGGILLLAGIRGDEPAGIALARQLIERLPMAADFPEKRQVVVIPEVNPDAVGKNQRFNLRGRDINRDFTSARPQPETRAVIGAIETYLPTLIVSLRELKTPGIDYDGPGAEAIARDLAAKKLLEIKKWGASTGSIGYYAGIQMDIPVITLSLSSTGDDAGGAAAWERYGALVMAAIQSAEKINTAPAAPSRAPVASKTRMENEQPKPEREAPPVAAPEVNDYHAALAYFDAGEYDAAGKAFERYQQEKACDDCAAYIEKCEQAAASMAAGTAHLDAGRQREALAEFHLVLSLNPRDKKAMASLYAAHHRLAEAQFAGGEFTAAAGNYSAALNYNQNCPDCRRRIAESEQAEEILHQGKTHMENGDYPAAIASFEEILSYNPDMPGIRRMLSDAHLRQGRALFAEAEYANAASHFESALKYDAGCRACDELAAASREMIQRREDGVAFFGQEAYARAIAVLEAAAGVNPRDPVVREYLYKSHFQLGRQLSGNKETLSAAVRHFEASLQYNDICPTCEKIIRELIENTREELNEYHYQQGKAFFLEGREASLERALKEWAKVDPDYRDVEKLIETARRLLENTGP